jgi:hypothetical protein
MNASWPYGSGTHDIGGRRSVPSWAEPAVVRRCWLCGIRLPADQMVPDGGSACLDLRWYCQDTWGCTQRWTARPAGVGQLGAPEADGKQAMGADAVGPVSA